jgi:hypothetical protein
MLPRWQMSIVACAGLAGGLIWSEGGLPPSFGADAASYSPVVPAPAIHAAVESNLKLVRQWLMDKDFASAAEAAHGLVALARLYGYQSAESDWRKRSSALQEVCTGLAEAVERKSAVESDKAVAACTRVLDDMARNPPAGARLVAKNFKPFGNSKTWMQLMDGAYVDAKRTETAKELELRALAIAEEVHVVGFLREDPKWRDSAAEVRDAALRTARLSKENDLGGARKALREVYQRCEACHERTRQ